MLPAAVPLAVPLAVFSEARRIACSFSDIGGADTVPFSALGASPASAFGPPCCALMDAGRLSESGCERVLQQQCALLNLSLKLRQPPQTKGNFRNELFLLQAAMLTTTATTQDLHDLHSHHAPA